MATILIEYSLAKEYFIQHKAELSKNSRVLAFDKDTGISIQLSANGDNPVVEAFDDTGSIYEIEVVQLSAFPQVVKIMYEKYLTSDVYEAITDSSIVDKALQEGGIPVVDSEEDDDEQEADITEEELNDAIEDKITEREDELDTAMYDFLSTVAGWDAIGLNITDEVVEDCKEHFLEYLARKHGVQIYRPMIIEYDNDDGTTDEEYEEYPYDCLEFEDEDNPIYR